MFWASSRTVIKKQHGMLANFLRGSYRTGLWRIFRINFSPFRKIDTENSKVDESAGLHRLMLSRTLSRSLKFAEQLQCFTAWRLSFSPPPPPPTASPPTMLTLGAANEPTMISVCQGRSECCLPSLPQPSQPPPASPAFPAFPTSPASQSSPDRPKSRLARSPSPQAPQYEGQRFFTCKF